MMYLCRKLTWMAICWRCRHRVCAVHLNRFVLKVFFSPRTVGINFNKVCRVALLHTLFNTCDPNVLSSGLQEEVIHTFTEHPALLCQSWTLILQIYNSSLMLFQATFVLDYSLLYVIHWLSQTSDGCTENSNLRVNVVIQPLDSRHNVSRCRRLVWHSNLSLLAGCRQFSLLQSFCLLKYALQCV